MAEAIAATSQNPKTESPVLFVRVLGGGCFTFYSGTITSELVAAVAAGVVSLQTTPICRYPESGLGLDFLVKEERAQILIQLDAAIQTIKQKHI